MHANFRLPGGICSQTKVRWRMIDTQTLPLTYANVIENCQGKVFRGVIDAFHRRQFSLDEDIDLRLGGYRVLREGCGNENHRLYQRTKIKCLFTICQC